MHAIFVITHGTYTRSFSTFHASTGQFLLLQIQTASSVDRCIRCSHDAIVVVKNSRLLSPIQRGLLGWESQEGREGMGLWVEYSPTYFFFLSRWKPSHRPRPVRSQDHGLGGCPPTNRLPCTIIMVCNVELCIPPCISSPAHPLHPPPPDAHLRI